MPGSTERRILAVGVIGIVGILIIPMPWDLLVWAAAMLVIILLAVGGRTK